MKIACVSVHDTRDKQAFAGRLWPMVEALQTHATELHHLGPLYHRIGFLPTLAVKKAYHKFIDHKFYTANRDRIEVKGHAVALRKRLAGLDPDVIVSLVSDGSQPIAYLETAVPIVIWTDSTFAGTLDFYPNYARHLVSAETIRDGLANERKALERSTLLLYMSEWGAQSALSNYDLDPTKVHVLPVGPGFDPGTDRNRVGQLIQERPSDRCRFLFIGLEWQRKGGDIVLETARRLNAAGLPTELTVVGCQPDIGEPLPPWVTVTGIIDKSSPEGLARMRELIGRSHFMFVPSRAEGMGIVFCEASAFGVPSLTTRVGGIPTVVQHGRNGLKLPLDAGADRYAEAVLALFADYGRYRALAAGAFREYEERLNWATISATLGDHLHEAIARAKASGSSGNRNRASGRLAS